MPIRQALGNTIDRYSTQAKSLGLPDFGISEWIAGGPTVNTNQRLAPQSFASDAAPTPNMSVNPNPNMSVTPPGYQRPTPQTQSPAPTPKPQGGDINGQENVDWYTNEFGNRVAITNPYDNIQPQGPSQQEIDSQFAPVLDVYNQAEGNLRGQLPGLISEAEAQAQASRGLLDNSKANTNELLGSQEQQTRYNQQNQTAQQRQTLQELQTANQQRFGGASSAGQAAGELQGREYQRNTFQIGQQAQQALQQIQQQRQTVERDYNQGLQQLEVNKQQAVNQIQRTFQDKLLEINARRGETESAKAQARMGALQELRNAAYQIDVSKAQFQAQLQMQAQQNASQLDSISKQYLSAGSEAQDVVDNNSAIPAPTNTVINSGRDQAQQYVGQIAPQSRRELDYGNPLANMFSNTQPAF
jgi:hypothetical protein